MVATARGNGDGPSLLKELPMSWFLIGSVGVLFLIGMIQSARKPSVNKLARFFLLALLAAVGWLAWTFLSWGEWLALSLGLLAAFGIPALFSLRSWLEDYVQTVVATMTTHLKEPYIGGIFSEQLAEKLEFAELSPRFNPGMTPYVDAFAAKDSEGINYVLLNPVAACLPVNEMMFIVAHEIGHHELGHTKPSLLNKVSNFFLSGEGGLASGIGAGVAVIAGAPIALALAGAATALAINSDRNKDMEHDADEYAVELLLHLEEDTGGAIQFFERVASMEEETSLVEDFEDTIFGSHPSSLERIENLSTQLEF
jgi:Zn-dependent protease with chaperone function